MFYFAIKYFKKDNSESCGWLVGWGGGGARQVPLGADRPTWPPFAPPWTPSLLCISKGGTGYQILSWGPWEPQPFCQAVLNHSADPSRRP